MLCSGLENFRRAFRGNQGTALVSEIEEPSSALGNPLNRARHLNLQGLLLMKYFFRVIRVPLGLMMLIYEWVTRPRRAEHSPQHQSRLDSETAKLKVYQFKTCPFCIKTRKKIVELGLNIETRDARRNQLWRTELLEQGGKIKVPCLRIENEDGSLTWMYESGAINDYLEQRFALTNHVDSGH